LANVCDAADVMGYSVEGFKGFNSWKSRYWSPPFGGDRSYPESAFPTVEAFEAYDRIAQHIRSIANIRQ